MSAEASSQKGDETSRLTFTTTYPSTRSAPALVRHTLKMANQNPMQDYLRRIQGQIQRSGGRGGFGGGGIPPARWAGSVAGLVLLGGGIWAVQNALFNVDGGHRAIKYRRTTGVSKEIYTEGAFLSIRRRNIRDRTDAVTPHRNPFHDSMV
jgi:hypothetical protein